MEQMHAPTWIGRGSWNNYNPRIILSQVCESLGYTHCLLSLYLNNYLCQSHSFITQPAYFYALRFQICLVRV